jgi:hypothetical protein
MTSARARAFLRRARRPRRRFGREREHMHAGRPSPARAHSVAARARVAHRVGRQGSLQTIAVMSSR